MPRQQQNEIERSRENESEPLPQQPVERHLAHMPGPASCVQTGRDILPSRQQSHQPVQKRGLGFFHFLIRASASGKKRPDQFPGTIAFSPNEAATAFQTNCRPVRTRPVDFLRKPRHERFSRPFASLMPSGVKVCHSPIRPHSSPIRRSREPDQPPLQIRSLPGVSKSSPSPASPFGIDQKPASLPRKNGPPDERAGLRSRPRLGET